MPQCKICGVPYSGYGHNGQPTVDGRVCDDCNFMYVIPERINQMFSNQRTDDEKPRKSGHIDRQAGGSS